MCKKQGLRADLSRATYLGSYFNLPPLRMSSPAPQIRTDEDFSMHVDARRRVPTGVYEENVRHVLECAEAFGILIALPRLDPLELLYEDIDSIRASA